MKYLRAVIYPALAAAISLVVISCGQNFEKSEDPIPSSLPKTVKQAYEDGRSIVLFSYREEITNSEAFADWGSYLEDFKEGKGSHFYYSKVNADKLRTPTPEAEEFTLFLKKGYPTYLYEDLIVEPQVYTAVYKRYSGLELDDVDRAFLPKTLESHY